MKNSSCSSNNSTAMFNDTAFSARNTENTKTQHNITFMNIEGTAVAVSFVVIFSYFVKNVIDKVIDIIFSVRLINTNEGTAYNDIRKQAQA